MMTQKKKRRVWPGASYEAKRRGKLPNDPDILGHDWPKEKWKSFHEESRSRATRRDTAGR